MKQAPLWARALLRCVASREQADDLLGDLEEAYRSRDARFAGRVRAGIETIDVTLAVLRARVDALHIGFGRNSMQDYKLGFRMLVKYPGLTIAGGLALALAIGVGAGWYDFLGDLMRPALSIPGGERVVEIEMRNSAASEDERRILHDLVGWRRDARMVEDLGAYRTIERNLVIGQSRPELVTLAEISASAFRVAPVAPLLGRPLIDSDERVGALPVMVIGYTIWQRQFGGRPDVVGQIVQLGRTPTTVVGVMPERFTFPVNHRLWIPLQLRASYAPLEGVPVRVFGRVAAGATQAQANAELSALAAREAEASPQTHETLRPRVLAYGGQSPGDRSIVEIVITHLPIALVLLIACVNVGTLIYARTATREAEIAMRHALGASRGRIVFQLFIESLILTAVAAVAGLLAANAGLKWGVTAYYSGQDGTLPFWLHPGLKAKTVLFAILLTAAAAALLSVMPAIKITGRRVQDQLRNLGAGGSTLRFGKLWTAAMVTQVALTVICIPPAMGIAHEAWRDHVVRSRFPGEQYLAVRVGMDEGAAGLFHELERRIAREPGVVSMTFGDRMPGMSPRVRRAEVETAPGAAPIEIPDLWTTAVGPRYFDTFSVPIVAGRDFHDGDRMPGSRAVLVNQAFARRYANGASPVGLRVRYATARQTPEAWFEVVGMVRDIGMTPTDLGEAPYIFHATTAEMASPLVMAVRTTANTTSLASRVREIATSLDPGLRLDDMHSLEEHAWRVDVPALIVAAALAGIVLLGLFMSAAGIFSLMSVSVARRTREIGLRAALGASPLRLLRGVLTRAGVLVGSGIVVGNVFLLIVAALSPEVDATQIAVPLLVTSGAMLSVGLIACVEPARRALGIQPTEALRDS